MLPRLPLPMLNPRYMRDMHREQQGRGRSTMTRHSISVVLGSLLVGLLLVVNAPAVSADDGSGGGLASPRRDFSTQQIAAFDALTATAPGAAMPDWYPVSYVAAPCITD